MAHYDLDNVASPSANLQNQTANMHKWNWDDLRLILAVAEHKSFASAARVLHINHTTVLRRINSFEHQHAIRIFDRIPSGYKMTGAGEELLESARAMQSAANELERKLIGSDLKLEGTIRVTTCDTLMASLLPKILDQFIKKHPQIYLEITTGSFVSDLAQRYADVAIRTGENPTETLIGRRISDVQFSIYAAVGFADQYSIHDPTQFDRWLAPDETLEGLGMSKWLRNTIPPSSIRLRADSLVTLRQAAQGGLGLTLLPCYLGDNTPGLEKIYCPELNNIKTGLWILNHKDLRNTARVSAFTSYASQELKKLITSN